MQERRNYIANALELRLSCTNPAINDMETLAVFTRPRWRQSGDCHYKGSVLVTFGVLFVVTLKILQNIGVVGDLRRSVAHVTSL